MRHRIRTCTCAAALFLLATAAHAAQGGGNDVIYQLLLELFRNGRWGF